MSVYDLITELCIKFSPNQKDLKQLRTLSYEILLEKRPDSSNGVTITNSDDSMCELLAWKFTLAHQYGLDEYSERIEEYGDVVRKFFGDQVLKFLLCLKQPPENVDDSLELDLSEEFKQMFNIPSKITTRISTPSLPKAASRPSVWEIAAKETFCKRRTWEDFGLPEPNKEKRFASELGPDSDVMLRSLPSVYAHCLGNNKNRPELPVIVKQSEFLKSVKYLLVGMESNCFKLNSTGHFNVVPNLTISGLTPQTVHTFCQDFLVCGRSFKLLNKISTFGDNVEQGGYIFLEFCQTIQRYLNMYRTIIFNCSDTLGPLKFDVITSEIRQHIKMLERICQNAGLPHGIRLLNYLYEIVLTIVDKKFLKILCGILFPCYQVYYARFLQQWLLYGILNDPFEEFFIKVKFKYISRRTRSYWTHSHVICDDLVPVFLADLKDDILNCGKSMNLLKLCMKTNKFCLYLMAKRPLIISCCLTSEQLSTLEQNVNSYYLEILSECGPILNLEQIIQKNKEQDPIFMNLIAKKRAVSLQRRELERKRKYLEERERKMEEFAALREQYDAVIQMKQQRIAAEIEKEMQLIEYNLRIEQTHNKLIEREAKILIDYYAALSEIADKRRKCIEKRIEILKRGTLEDVNADDSSRVINLEVNSSNESFYSVIEPQESHNLLAPHENATPVDDNVKKVENQSSATMLLHSSESLDIINANTNENDNNLRQQTKETFEEAKANKIRVLKDELGVTLNENQRILVPNTISRDLDTFSMAKKIRAKVLSEEMGIFDYEPIKQVHQETKTESVATMSELQRNRLRVMNSEFGISMNRTETGAKRRGQCTINRNLAMKSSDCFYPVQLLDNAAHILNQANLIEQVASEGKNEKTTEMKKSASLSLDLQKIDIVVGPSPMSVDSTPMSDSTNFSHLLSVRSDMDSIPSTSETQISSKANDVDNNPFDFNKRAEEKGGGEEVVSYVMPITRISNKAFSKRLTSDDSKNMKQYCLKFSMHGSIEFPLAAQLKLVNNELLKYFLENENYFQHLHSLRNYFFLQNDEFSRCVTDKLYEYLYRVRNPNDFINIHNLHHLIVDALKMTYKLNENNGNYLSFKMNKVPMQLNLRDPNVLNCISLTYNVNWPLNILLTNEIIVKYDEVFKYLLKMNRVAWVLKRICVDLKSLAKETGKKEIYLMMSPHYRRLHQCRHVMLHFIQTFQNYIVGDALQTSLKIFEEILGSVTNIESLHAAHTSYIKNIMFLCLLDKKAESIQKIMEKIFKEILIFYDLLRARPWQCVDGTYVHSNYRRLNVVFENFEKYVLYLFKAGNKIAKSGYQPQFMQLLDMLDVNSYYKNKLKVDH